MLKPDVVSLMSLLNEQWMEEEYKDLSGLVVGGLTSSAGSRGLILDLDSLPTHPVPIKELFIRWLLKVNQSRIEVGEKPLVTYELAMQCPLWKVIDPPFISTKLTKEKMFNKPRPTIKTIGSKPPIGSINKSSKIKKPKKR